MAAVSAIRQYPQPAFGMQSVDMTPQRKPQGQDSFTPQAAATFASGKERFPGHRTAETEKLSWGRRICTKMIRWYQENKLFHGGALTFRCTYPEKARKQGKFIPSCSQYTLEAIQKKGVVIGCLLGFGRIMNCNPISQKVPFLKDRFLTV